MTGVVGFLAENGAMLLTGATALLGLGCGAAAACRSPVHRQRVCEIAVAGTLAWGVLACVPLPRASGERALVPTAPIVTASSVVPAEIPPELIARPRTPDAVPAVPRPYAAPASGSRHLPNPTAGLALAYVTGAVACGAWLLLGHVLLWRTLRKASAAPEDVARMIDSRLRPGCRRPRVLVSEKFAGPLTCGVWRPTIVLPMALLDEGRAAQLRQVLLHELGHVRQGDGWGNLLFCLALPVLYAHPAYWWLRRAAELARELVVDDWASRADGKDAYVGELVALARARAGGAAATVGGIGILQRRSHFYRRMHMLLQRHGPLATGCSGLARAFIGLAGVVAVVAATAAVGVRPARAQDRPAEQPPAERSAAADERRALEKELKEIRNRANAIEAKLRAAAVEEAAKASLDPSLSMEERMRVRRGMQGARPEAEKPAEAAADRPAVSKPAARAEAAPGAAALSAGGSVGGVQLDLVNLGNSLIDAAGAVRLSKVNYELASRRAAQGQASTSEAAAAEVGLQTAEKRVKLLRSIAQVATDQARAELERMTRLREQRLVSEREVGEATARVKVLELIVQGGE